jgi:hypothetical protein
MSPETMRSVLLVVALFMSGCAASVPSPERASEPSEISAEAPTSTSTEEFEISAGSRVAHPCVDGATDGCAVGVNPDSTPFPVEENALRIEVTAQWTAMTPAAGTLFIGSYSDNGAYQGLSCSSPCTVLMDPWDGSSEGSVSAWPTMGGATAGESVQITVTITQPDRRA